MKPILLGIIVIYSLVGTIFAQSPVVLKKTQPAPINRTDSVLSVDQILNDYVTAIGGAEAQKKITNYFGTGTIKEKVFGIEMNGKFTVYAKAPGKFHLQSQTEWGNSMTGFNGDSMWVFPSMATLKMKDSDREYFQREFAFHYGVNLRELYERFESLGSEVVEGRPTNKVKCFPKAGPPVTLYFDAETKLLVRKDSSYFDPSGDQAASFLFSDYQTIQGIKFPTTLSVVLGEKLSEQIFHFTEIKLNAEMKDDFFVNPLQILVDRDWIDTTKK